MNDSLALKIDNSPLILRKFLNHISVIENRSEQTVKAYYFELYHFFVYLCSQKLSEKEMLEYENDYLMITENITDGYLNSIVRDDILNYLYYLKEKKKLSARSRNHALSVISKFFNYCEKYPKILSVNPCNNIPYAKAEKKLPFYLTLDECTKMLGTAKTHSAISFAIILSQKYKKRVLFVDIDPQSSATKSLGCYNENDEDGILSIADVMLAKEPIAEKAIKHSKYGVDVIPSSFDLLGADRTVMGDVLHPQQFHLKTQLKPLENDYDFCIFDFLLYPTITAVNALCITDDVLVPIKLGKYGTDGLENVIESVVELKDFNPKLVIRDCFSTMYSRANSIPMVFQSLKKHLLLSACLSIIHIFVIPVRLVNRNQQIRLLFLLLNVPPRKIITSL